MRKKFNVTGVCVKDKHYMVDVSEKISQIVDMVEDGEYFTINRPRQFGKTTTLNILKQVLSDRYLVIDTSFEGVGDNLFKTEEEFCGNVFETFADSFKFTEKETYELLLKYNTSENFRELSNAISSFIIETGKKVILLVDEIDKSSNNRIFLQFLGLLRNKYLSAKTNKDVTFQSVILAGVHDIRTLKLSIRDESEARFNSPWNIAAKFEVDMSFDPREIETMLLAYKTENHIDFDTTGIARLIHRFTNGYPYLVSDICKIIDEKLDAVWIRENVYMAVKTILNEKNTLFENVIKNIENHEDMKSVVNDLLILGRRISYNPFAYEIGLQYGIFAESDGTLVIHNKIFEELIYHYMTEQSHIRNMQISLTNVELAQFVQDQGLDVEHILLKFQNFMFEEFRFENERFYESQARLIFLAYLKPILNGKGFYFVEPQTRENKRLDVVVIYGNQKHIIELKIWNGVAERSHRGPTQPTIISAVADQELGVARGGDIHHEEAYEQLLAYMHIKNAAEGYLLTFDFRKGQNKARRAEWVQIGDKRIFDVIV